MIVINQCRRRCYYIQWLTDLSQSSCFIFSFFSSHELCCSIWCHRIETCTLCCARKMCVYVIYPISWGPSILFETFIVLFDENNFFKVKDNYVPIAFAYSVNCIVGNHFIDKWLHSSWSSLHSFPLL